MRAIIQRVTKSNLYIDNKLYSSINKGMLVLLAIEKSDEYEDLEYIAKKTLGLRIFSDSEDKMNLSIKDIDGEIMIVSQFTLYGDARKGNRPSFTNSADSKKGEYFYEKFIDKVKENIKIVETGVFGADMQIEFVNDGPVTIQLDSSKIY
ncbi:D-aminoacyl-tRNA deacylase [Helcococcus sueciensis]|uniref:D-aminoacyl-tRNA deacylase n=1 Tax=Helcococcus sueciensis TaxID=241555 RepID=UPI000415EACF|nr:D-aminoacyl-tRNA deacylase [Helcococcus sueciensis]